MIRSSDEKLGWLHWMALAGVLALAAVLRFYALHWGLPNALHSYSYHPDEFLTIGAAFVSIYIGRSFDPRLYNYPSLYLYLSALAIAVGMGYGLMPDGQSVYLAARIVTVLMSIAAVGATYWAARVMFGEMAGLLAALVLAIAPLHVQHSHFATVDVPSTLFVALCLGFAGLIVKRGSWRDYVLSGVMAGLAGGTKYNAVLVIFSPMAAHFLRERPNWRSMLSGRLWAIPACAIATFLISTPGSVLRYNEFLSGLTYELHHASQGHGLVFAGTGNGFVYTLMHSLRYGMGVGFLALFVLVLLWTLKRRDKMGLAILAFVIPYFVLISLSQVRFARYTLPLFPAAAILVGWLIWNLHAVLNRRAHSAALMWVAACIFVLSVTLSYTALLDSFFAGPDPRDQAATWIKKHISSGSSIGLLDYPWYYSPPLAKDFGFGSLVQRQEAMTKTPYELSLISGKQLPDWAIVTKDETIDAERLRVVKGLAPGQRAQVETTLGQTKLISEHYRVTKSFGSRREGWGLVGKLPHDMRYALPVVTIYERAK